MPQFTDPQGVVVTYYVWPVDTPIGVLQLAHGLGEYAKRYESFAKALNEAGFTVYANDLRGHGQTGLDQHGGDHAKLGPGGLDAAIANIRQLSAIITKENPTVPLVILGHSLGSMMVQKIINSHARDYDAAVLTGTAYRTPTTMNPGDLNKKHKNLGTTGFEWLSRDPAVADAFLADPLCFRADVLKLFGLADGLRLYGRPAKDLGRDLPLLILNGSDDSVANVKSVEKLAAAYRERSGLTDVELKIYPDARHEVFNETNKEEVIADLVAWLTERVNRLSPAS
ncbi:alpha/beta fold hydrolase [Homoserinimonas sp. OAct 916]|uniref:alpha/beta fold hydrolase n=1 Tax=Homoserinimonas sp. OAct 916 TaxID=2211450 RepID=UPI000DBEA330|nr:alpha/beta fold hydrolase [Homoserinimonas sp. OAct 916]